MKLLVVGGAGYVGSTTANLLLDQGHEVHVLDDLSTGYRKLVPDDCTFHRASLHDASALSGVLGAHRFDAVLHFAAFIAVGESVREPLAYYRNNIGGTLALLTAMRDAGTRTIVVSSTAAVYGEPQSDVLTEQHPLAPINPYGWTKRVMEQVLEDCGVAWGLRSVALRYFNAAGADPKGRCGEWHDPETHLVPLALRAAVGQIPRLTVFGEDYPTRDGTCVRDYVHVVDLAEAHVLAVRHLADGGPSRAYNLGSESGSTVREVLDSVEQVLGVEVPHVVGERRAGDAAVLVASSGAIRSELGWQARNSDLDRIVHDAWAWHSRNGFCGGRHPAGSGT